VKKPAPAEITPGQAAMASLNFESMFQVKRLMDKYRKLGKAMAKKWVKIDE
jgi:hypothetical protein